MPDKEKHQHAKKRVSKACDCCRKSKTKCDGQRPCTRCLQDGKICTYMTKKKAGQVYPAAYVDLLETRVSVLVQTLTQLLEKSKVGASELYDFCAEEELQNSDGEWDINKVISRLLPAERLQNLAESSQSYSLHDITDVVPSPSASTHTAQNASRSPSPRAMHSHTHISKARRNSDNHVHKIPSSRNSNSSSASSIQSRFSLTTTSPSTSYTESPLASSLDIFKQPRRATTLDSILSGPEDRLNTELELDSVNFSDTNTGSTLMSPVYSIDEIDTQTKAGSQTLESSFQDLFHVNSANPQVTTVSGNPFMNGYDSKQGSAMANGNSVGVNMFGFDWDIDSVKKEAMAIDSFDF